MKKIYSLLLASALVFTSCSDFLDTNIIGKTKCDRCKKRNARIKV